MAITFNIEEDTSSGGYWKADYFWGPTDKQRSQTKHPTREAAEWEAYIKSDPRSFHLRTTMLLSTALDAYEKAGGARGTLFARRDTDRLRTLLAPHVSRPASALTREDFLELHALMEKPDHERQHFPNEFIGPRPFMPCVRALKPTTIGKYFGQLSAFSYFCVAFGFCNDDPVFALYQQFSVVHETTPMVVPVKSHLDGIHARVGLVSRVILGLQCYGGAEPVEVTRTRWCDMDPVGDRLFLRHTVLPGDDPLNPAGRWVPLEQRLKLDLLALRASIGGRDEDLVIPTGNRESLKSVDIIAQVRQLQVLAGYKGKTSERSGVIGGFYKAADLRNFAAVKWARKHRNVRVLAELLNCSERHVIENLGAIIHLKDDVAAFHTSRAKALA